MKPSRTNASIKEAQDAKAAQDEITVSVRELLINGAMFEEIMAVLRDHLIKTKGLVIIKKYDQWTVYTDPRKAGYKTLLTSPSLSTCVDFALKYEVPNG